MAHRIKLTESQIRGLVNETQLTEYKFYNNVQRFLSDLLKNPVHASVPFILQANGISRNKLLYYLKHNGIINRHNTVCDVDLNGEPKPATMKIRYSVPKKDFAKKMKRMFIQVMKRNVPNPVSDVMSNVVELMEAKQRKNDKGETVPETCDKCGSKVGVYICGEPIFKCSKCGKYFGTVPFNVNECEGGDMGGDAAMNADAAGQYVQPLFGKPIRRKVGEATTTTTVGDYTYDVPCFGDEETLSRNKQKGGSNSVEVLDEILDKAMNQVRQQLKQSIMNDKGEKFVENPYGEDGRELVNNEWMVHFSEMMDVISIASNGFTQGNAMDDTRSASYNKVKTTDKHYNFAYLATDVLNNTNGCKDSFMSYMKENKPNFVMFKANGFRFGHKFDKENQVVFNAIQQDTKVLVLNMFDNWCVMKDANAKFANSKNPIQKGENGGDDMNPKNALDGVLYYSKDINKVINWVMTNFEQYKKAIKY